MAGREMVTKMFIIRALKRNRIAGMQNARDMVGRKNLEQVNEQRITTTV